MAPAGYFTEIVSNQENVEITFQRFYFREFDENADNMVLEQVAYCFSDDAKH